MTKWLMTLAVLLVLAVPLAAQRRLELRVYQTILKKLTGR